MKAAMNDTLLSDALDEAAEVVWAALFGLGSIKDTIAHTQSSLGLSQAGLIARHPPHPGSEDESFMKAALDRALTYGFLDCPKPGQYRAILKNSRDFEPEDWDKCVIGFMGDNEGKNLGRDEIVKGAVIWARVNLGLQGTRLAPKGDLWNRIEASLNRAIRDGLVAQTIFYGVERLRLLG